MNTHRDWNSRGFDLAPVAPCIGPFARSDVLASLWRHAPEDGAALQIAETSEALLPLVLTGDTLSFVGHRDLVDYRSPLGWGVADLVEEIVGSLPAGTRVRFDSLPREAVEVIGEGLRRAGLDPAPVEGDVAAVLELPASFDEYLAGIGKKERHELRRKRRRFEAEAGPLDLARVVGDVEVFDQFVTLHRRSDGDKGSFMTAAMEAFFRDLYALPGWGIDALRDGGGTVVAAAFGYVDESGYYLYNSAFDTVLSRVSPGQVMLGAMIERAVQEGRRIFDFLKGDENYKFRLGAEPRPLYEIEVVR